jgi:hypothetical protein
MKSFSRSLGNKTKFLVLGCGFSGNFFAKTIRKFGCTALTSSRAKKQDPNSFVFNSENGKVPDEKIFNGVTHILSCIPPDKNGRDPVLGSLKSKLQDLSLEWIGYLSTTGVYGNTKGEWVSEIDQPSPFQKRSHMRLNCEREWIKSGLPVQIFRLPGIYGPGRSVFDKVSNSEIIEIKKKNHFFSRIHVEDIASAIHNSLQQKTPGEIFNITDDLPSESSDIVKYAASLLKIKNIKKINFDDPQLNEKTKSFYLDNKKVSNRKIKKILGWTPKYRNYKLGLKSIFKLIS